MRQRCTLAVCVGPHCVPPPLPLPAVTLRLPLPPAVPSPSFFGKSEVRVWIDDTLYQGAFDFPSFPLDSSPRVCLGKGLDGELGPCYFFKEGVSEEVLKDLRATHHTDRYG